MRGFILLAVGLSLASAIPLIAISSKTILTKRFVWSLEHEGDAGIGNAYYLNLKTREHQSERPKNVAKGDISYLELKWMPDGWALLHEGGPNSEGQAIPYYYHMATGNYQRTRPFGQVDDLPDGWITKHADGPNGEPGKGGPLPVTEGSQGNKPVEPEWIDESNGNTGKTANTKATMGLPEGWVLKENRGKPYYLNTKTGVSQWGNPNGASGSGAEPQGKKLFDEEAGV